MKALSLASIFSCWLILLCISPAEADLPAYDPVFRMGRTHATNLLIVFWSHRTVESGRVFRDVIRKLDPEIKSGALRVQFYQRASSQGLNEATAFLCVPKQNYGQLVVEYLDRLASQSSFSTPTFQWTIFDIGNSLGLPRDIASCAKGKQGDARLTALKTFDAALSRNFGTAAPPTLILNGARVEARDANDLRRHLLKD